MRIVGMTPTGYARWAIAPLYIGLGLTVVSMLAVILLWRTPQQKVTA